MIVEEEEGQQRRATTHRCILSLFHFRSWFVRHFFCSLRERNDDEGNDARDGGERSFYSRFFFFLCASSSSSSLSSSKAATPRTTTTIQKKFECGVLERRRREDQQQRQQRQRTTTTIIGRDGSFAGALIFASRVFVSARFTCTVLRFFSAYFSSTDCRISSHFGAKNESNQQQH